MEVLLYNNPNVKDQQNTLKQMLKGAWGKWKLDSLLVGLKTDAVTEKLSVVVPQKAKTKSISLCYFLVCA